MKNFLLLTLCGLVLTACVFAQPGKATTSPASLAAGENITITVIVDKAPSVVGTSISGRIEPREPKDNAQGTSFTLAQKGGDLTVYVGTCPVPLNAWGIWYIKNVTLNLPTGNTSVSLATNEPEFTVTPIKITLPSSGKVEITTH